MRRSAPYFFAGMLFAQTWVVALTDGPRLPPALVATVLLVSLFVAAEVES